MERLYKLTQNRRTVWHWDKSLKINQTIRGTQWRAMRFELRCAASEFCENSLVPRGRALNDRKLGCICYIGQTCPKCMWFDIENQFRSLFPRALIQQNECRCLYCHNCFESGKTARPSSSEDSQEKPRWWMSHQNCATPVATIPRTAAKIMQLFSKLIIGYCRADRSPLACMYGYKWKLRSYNQRPLSSVVQLGPLYCHCCCQTSMTRVP